jgi:hypothetical protein
MSQANRPIDPENLVAVAIEAAEDILDPLEGLVENTARDPGAPFAPDALERLSALKKDDRAAFEALRAQLKGAGVRVTALDEAIAEENGETGGRGPTQADMPADGGLDDPFKKFMLPFPNTGRTGHFLAN